MVFSDPHSSEFDATISETAIPAPSRLQRLRNGRSVTPAMGATIRLFLSWMDPIFMFAGFPPKESAEWVLILYAAAIAEKVNFAQRDGAHSLPLEKSSPRGTRPMAREPQLPAPAEAPAAGRLDHEHVAGADGSLVGVRQLEAR